MAFSYTTADGRLTVYEGFSGYYLRLNVPGDGYTTVGCGDGVDWFFDKENQPYWVGTPELHKAIVIDIEANEAGWVEAYFGIVDGEDDILAKILADRED